MAPSTGDEPRLTLAKTATGWRVSCACAVRGCVQTATPTTPPVSRVRGLLVTVTMFFVTRGAASDHWILYRHCRPTHRACNNRKILCTRS